MKMGKFLLWTIVPAILFSHANNLMSHPVCGASGVQLRNNVIQIMPSGLDDTSNIQCALDLAVERNIADIRLARGDFYISSLSTQEFVGTMQGSGKDHTRIRLLDRSIDCSSTDAAITFAGGKPRLRWLSLIRELGVYPCLDGRLPNTIIRFTGLGEDPSFCSSDLIDAIIDGTAIEGYRSAFVTAITVGPTKSISDCQNAVLGSFRLTRSTISQFSYGVDIRMRGGATVVINKNIFARTGWGLVVRDSGAKFTVTGNQFINESFSCGETSGCEVDGRGIVLLNLEPHKAATRMDVYANTFEFRDGDYYTQNALYLYQSPGATDVSISVSGNTFLAAGSGAYAPRGRSVVFSTGVSGAVIKGNRFSEVVPRPELAFVRVESGEMDEVTGWTIDSNVGFSERDNWPHIFLGENVTKALIGPDQGAVVIDQGYDNTVLPQ